MPTRLMMFALPCFLLLTTQVAFAQTDLEDQNVKEHQIFYEEDIQDVKDVIYEESGEPINYEFKKEEKKIILKEYDGESKVKVTYVNQKGSTVEKTRYSCYIHPKPPS